MHWLNWISNSARIRSFSRPPMLSGARLLVLPRFSESSIPYWRPLQDGLGSRIFQLRTYESPSYRDHVRKVEMFNAGEFDIFTASGFHNVFFGDTLIGTRMPCLTYMLSMTDSAEMDKFWEAFRNDPNWKKLSNDPKYAFEPIVNTISNLVLSPLSSPKI